MKRAEPKFNANDEVELRAFYESCGISEKTTEAAIAHRRKTPAASNGKPSPIKGYQRKRGPTGKAYFVPK